MIGTPPSFAGTPKSARGDYDVLAEMLRAARLTGSVFLRCAGDRRVERPLGIAVHDHIIVGKDEHASLKALKLM